MYRTVCTYPSSKPGPFRSIALSMSVPIFEQVGANWLHQFGQLHHYKVMTPVTVMFSAGDMSEKSSIDSWPVNSSGSHNILAKSPNTSRPYLPILCPSKISFGLFRIECPETLLWGSPSRPLIFRPQIRPRRRLLRPSNQGHKYWGCPIGSETSGMILLARKQANRWSIYIN